LLLAPAAITLRFMRPGSFRLTRQRAARAVAGFVAAFLLTGNVLAAAGMCVVRASADTRVAVQAAADDAESAPCAEHLAAEAGSPSTGSNHHCPTEDPSAQTRTVDLPSPQLMVALAAVLFQWSDAARQPAARLSTDDPAESRPLYARLQRLRL
jgi:hypothetical protein